MDQFSYMNSPAEYIDSMYQSYKTDPQSVDGSWQQFFQGFDFSLKFGQNGASLNGHAPTGEISETEFKVRDLIMGYRSRGHLESKTNPVRPRKDRKARLKLTDFGLSDADLDTEFQAGKFVGLGKAKLRDIIAFLEKTYKGAIGFEFMHVREPEIVDWFLKKIEKDSLTFNPSIEEKKRILKKLNEAVVFESFLQKKFVGQKRFSLEGGESTIPALDTIINTAAALGVEEAIIGMAHRGRLNVLVNIMSKTYEMIFNEFEGGGDLTNLSGGGDVKYHMGYSAQIVTPSGKMIDLKLAPNPSHLEAVNPVVTGFARAKIDGNHNHDASKVLPILIHGDGAVAGQGIMYEILQMSMLAGYNTGGTIHFVINNQVSFTTDFEDARSSIYCTDITEIVDSPVLHVNGDDLEAVYYTSLIAAEYRQKFGKDIFIDMVCYRRHGHNESDEPRFTQPALYKIIDTHPNPREVYVKQLIAKGEIDEAQVEALEKEFRDMLQDRLDMVKQQPLKYAYQKFEKEWKSLRRTKPEDFDSSPNTGVAKSKIEKIAKALMELPSDFKPIRQIENLLKDRKKQFSETKTLPWATAELLAYGSLLLEQKTVRISGQDVQRGTFSHRHAVMNDAESNKPYCQIKNLSADQAQFYIYNSLLSEYGVLGFEFGYAMANPNALVIWEAQFGDFANGAQIMIDQFVSSSESKWQRMTGLVMLLPHGYEGQGPEHSNAHPERFLQLCAEYNMIVANITTPANIFHLLRRQLTWDFRKPCVVMSPKSLLRHPQCVSPVEDFVEGTYFKEVIGDSFADSKKVRNVVLCTGKIYYELADRQNKENRKDLAIIRLEQLHPFPFKQLEVELKNYKKANIVWVQEEPENMGYWDYLQRIWKEEKTLIARPSSSSPATGFMKLHNKEQKDILDKVFGL